MLIRIFFLKIRKLIFSFFEYLTDHRENCYSGAFKFAELTNFNQLTNFNFEIFHFIFKYVTGKQVNFFLKIIFYFSLLFFYNILETFT